MFLCPRTAVFPVRLGPLLLVPQERVGDLRWREEGEGERRGRERREREKRKGKEEKREEREEEEGGGGGEGGRGGESLLKTSGEVENKLTENRVALFLHR